MFTKHTASALALAAAAALTLVACGGDDDDSAPPAPCQGAGCGGGDSGTAAIQPARLDLDVREEMLKPGATVSLQVEVEDGWGRDVSALSAANVQVGITGDTTGGARLSATQLSTQRGEANFSITLGSNLGTVIVKASADRLDNNIANGIADELARQLGMVVTQQGGGLNWELPTEVFVSSGQTLRLDDADDGRKPRSYAVTGAGGLTLAECGDDVCLTVPAGAAHGSHNATFTVRDAAGSTLSMPVTVVVN